ncbi:hypothetical protein K431DRAFT_334085 [Polychaeton citri CBS 116435]|uniref:Zn(2)-C6 fungal-type domain-containing protein n=1 Tax=Polychaeton citri CBS 116435 TaxID=1314669 RepID=A0A9P4QFZ9_9PEZI|nr:hypothetical protein K431DRAFT_334085 [Polychaeton citri CBS 116435]
MMLQNSPPSPSTAQTAQLQPGRVRLRQACDFCTAAKVRCDKGRPACQRCLDSDQSCRYSASRRYGKRAKHVKTCSQQTRPSPSTKDSPLTPPQSSATEVECCITSGYHDIGWDNNNASLTATETTPPFSTRNELEVSGDLASCGLPNLQSTSFVPLCDEWMEQPEFPWGTDESQHREDMSLSIPALPIEQRSSTREKTSNTDMIGKRSSDDFPIRIEHALECEARAINILRSLNYSPTLQAPMWEGSLPEEHSNAMANARLHRSASAVHTMETLLFTNKAALNDLMQMLECRCAENPHIVLLYTTILHKVIFWYKVAVTAKYHCENVELKPMKIQFGMLDLDEDDYASLHRAAIIRELHKAGSVIQAFEIRSVTKGECIYTKVSPWGRLAIRAVREELEQLIQETEGCQIKRY